MQQMNPSSIVSIPKYQQTGYEKVHKPRSNKKSGDTYNPLNSLEVSPTSSSNQKIHPRVFTSALGVKFNSHREMKPGQILDYPFEESTKSQRATDEKLQEQKRLLLQAKNKQVLSM